MPISQISASQSISHNAYQPSCQSATMPPLSAFQNHNYWPSCLQPSCLLTYALLSRLLSHFDLFFLEVKIFFCRFSEQVPSYEKSMLEVSRRIRNKSVPPPAPSSVSSATLRALSRPPTPTPTPGGPGRYCSCNSNDKRTYASNITYTQMFDYKRSTPSRGYWEYVSWGLVDWGVILFRCESDSRLSIVHPSVCISISDSSIDFNH